MLMYIQVAQDLSFSYSSLDCVLNLQILTQAISLVFSYLCLTGCVLSARHSEISVTLVDRGKRRKLKFFQIYSLEAVWLMFKI